MKTKESRITKVIDWLSWKFQLYDSYEKEGFKNVNFRFLFNELISKQHREQNYYSYKNSYKRHLLDVFGDRIGLTLVDGTSISSFTETFLDRNYTLFDDFLPKKGETVIDVGAQHGDYSLLCSKIYSCKKVYALEPVHENYEILLSNISMNGGDNIEPIEVAVSENDGNSELFQNGDMANSSENGKRINCQTMRLDSLETNEVDLLKIDVEGAELSVVKGAINTLSRFHPRLIIETHSKLLRKTVEEQLFLLGYRLAHEGRKIIVDEPGMDVVQNLFYSFDRKSQDRRD